MTEAVGSTSAMMKNMLTEMIKEKRGKKALGSASVPEVAVEPPPTKINKAPEPAPKEEVEVTRTISPKPLKMQPFSTKLPDRVESSNQSSKLRSLLSTRVRCEGLRRRPLRDKGGSAATIPGQDGQTAEPNRG